MLTNQNLRGFFQILKNTILEGFHCIRSMLFIVVTDGECAVALFCCSSTRSRSIHKLLSDSICLHSCSGLLYHITVALICCKGITASHQRTCPSVIRHGLNRKVKHGLGPLGTALFCSWLCSLTVSWWGSINYYITLSALSVYSGLLNLTEFQIVRSTAQGTESFQWHHNCIWTNRINTI